MLDSSGTFCVGDEDFWAWTWNDNTDGVWVKGEGEASAVVFSHDLKTNILFARVPKGQDASWNPKNVMNQTGDLTTQLGKTYKITGWYNGSWQN